MAVAVAAAAMPTSGEGWRELRESRQLAVVDVVERTGLNRSTIEKLELGGAVNRSTQTLVGACLGLPVFERDE
jgi:transcriptional regulator with XRE-family HTH domain